MGCSRKISIVLVAALALSLGTRSQGVADLIVRDLSSAGDGLLTFDEQSGLEWLDLTQIHLVSFNQVDSLIGPGGIYEGFRVATQQEVEELLSHTGIPIPTAFDSFTNFSFDPGNQFIDLFGQTGLIGFPNERASAGTIRVDFGNPQNVLMYEVQAGLLGELQPFGRIRKVFTGEASTGGFGIFLTRDSQPVPEPIGGAVTGMSSEKGKVVCHNLTTRKAVRILLDGATSWNCEDAGLVVNPGDKITIQMNVRGTAN